MSYLLNEVTIRTENTPDGIEKIGELWSDIFSGKLPLLFTPNHQPRKDIILLSRYSNYASDESGAYNLTVMAVSPAFVSNLNQAAIDGHYKKYEIVCDGEADSCSKKAWETVWNEQTSQHIKRLFTEDYEVNLPSKYSVDGKSHCILYIAVE